MSVTQDQKVVRYHFSSHSWALVMPLGKAKVVIVLSGSGMVVSGVAELERSSRTAFGTGARALIISGVWEKGTETSVAVRVAVALLVPALVLVGLVTIILVAGGARVLGVVCAWMAGGRPATREEKRNRATATWKRRMGAFIVELVEEERGWAMRR